MNGLPEKLRELLRPILGEEKAELVDLEVKGKPGSQTIKIFVDKVGGIHLDACERISRMLSDELDFEGVIPGRYRLEVSSPGLTRPLCRAQDFQRNLQRRVEVQYRNGGGERSFQGKIVNASDESIQIEGEDELRTIPISRIRTGKLKLPW